MLKFIWNNLNLIFIVYFVQEPILFSTSIKENILYGLDDNETASDEQFLEAVQLAHVDEFVQALPQGYDTPAGERGIALSGGQRQRIAIARAIIKVLAKFCVCICVL